MKWNEEFTSTLRPLLSSLIARGSRLPKLNSTQFRNLIRDAKHDLLVDRRQSLYQIDFQADTAGAISLLSEHPALRDLCSDESESSSVGLMAVGSGIFLSKDKALLRILEGIARTALDIGVGESVARLDRLLTLGQAHNLPGFEATFVVGMRLADDEWSIAAGLSATSYDHFRARLLHPYPASSYDEMVHRHIEVDAPFFVLIRESRWGPAVAAAPSLSSDLGLRLSFLHEESVESVVDLLALAVGRPLVIVGQSQLADGWVYDLLNLSLGANMHGNVEARKTAAQYHDLGLTLEQREEFRLLFSCRHVIRARDRKFVELAVSRLSSALGRRGALADEDMVLDIAIALEALYRPGTGEIAEKLSSRAAWLLGRGWQERKAIRRAIKRFYGLRSRIAHGSDLDSVQDISEEAFDIARRTLDRYTVDRRIPEDADWPGIVMGELEQQP